MDMETEEATFRTVRSELEQSLKTSTTQHASLQAHHTEVQKKIVLVKDQYKKCMETNLELLEKLHKAEARFLTDKSIKVSKQLSTGKASKRNQPRPSSEHGVAQKRSKSTLSEPTMSEPTMSEPTMTVDQDGGPAPKKRREGTNVIQVQFSRSGRHIVHTTKAKDSL
jgi:hypothetical protein